MKIVDVTRIEAFLTLIGVEQKLIKDFIDGNAFEITVISPDKNSLINEAFERLWKKYPRKLGKEAARKKYIIQAKKDPDIEMKIDKAIDKYKSEISRLDTEEHYILHGATFFYNRWIDYYNMESSAPEPEKLLATIKRRNPNVA